MILIVSALALALIWSMVSGGFSPGNLAFGFVLGLVALWLVRHRFGAGAFDRGWEVVKLLTLFIYELFASSVRVAVDVLRPNPDFRPAIVAVPLDLDDPAAITVLANLISLTPGTLSVDVSDDCKTLYIHAMDASDPDALREDLKQGFERRVRKAFG